MLLYGHMDKQPPLDGLWEEGLGPYKPVIRDGKLYGRGGADDGYAIFSCVTAIKALKEQNVPHGRMVIIIEGCEESGSKDLPFYVDHLKGFSFVSLLLLLLLLLFVIIICCFKIKNNNLYFLEQRGSAFLLLLSVLTVAVELMINSGTFLSFVFTPF